MTLDSQPKNLLQRSTVVGGKSFQSGRDIRFSFLNLENVRLFRWFRRVRLRQKGIQELNREVQIMKTKIESLKLRNSMLSEIEKMAFDLAEMVLELAKTDQADFRSVAIARKLKSAINCIEEGAQGLKACRRAEQFIKDKMDRWIQKEVTLARVRWPEKFSSEAIVAQYALDLRQYIRGVRRSLLFGDYCSLEALEIEPRLSSYSRLYALSIEFICCGINHNEIDDLAAKYLNNFMKDMAEKVAGI